MNEPLKRRSLIAVSPAEPPPAEAIAAVAARNGFPEAEPRPPAPAPAAQTRPEPGQGSNRRRRQPTGRDHQFTTRLRQDTLDMIYSFANERDVPIAQVIEEAMAALQAQRKPA